ncbi:MAG: AGE family epimerase/isomerase [Microbacterium sp.]|uniref:AGE family epimerase/isomerase n=1 Tax=Microbacterium sp. TaxID=51671 RepID=UPI003F994D01
MKWGPAGGADALLDSDPHHAELAKESARLVDFFDGPAGSARFAWRRNDGTVDTSRPLAMYNVARLVHCFGTAHMLGHPRAGEWAEDGIRLLLNRFADPDAVGFADSIDTVGGVIADTRTTYAHAFALLAGSTGVQAGIADADRVLQRVKTAIDTLLWREEFGVAVDAVAPSGHVLEAYRGQNANMHLTEAFLAVYELDGEAEWLRRAQRIAQRLVLRTTGSYDGRIPEHYTAQWQVDADYGRDHPLDQFRPFGTMPGHAMEWARLLLNIAAHTADDGEISHCATQLFAGAIRDGREEGIAGLAYTVDFAGRVVGDARTHWVAAESLGASAWLARTTGAAEYASHYAEFWNDITTHFVDPQGGSWWHELDTRNAPVATVWDGKPDLYHAYQATLGARLTRPCGIAVAARYGAIRAVQERNP